MSDFPTEGMQLTHILVVADINRSRAWYEDVTMAAPWDENVVDHSFTIRVPDCRRAYEALLLRGAMFLTPPHRRGQEIRCFFRDPDGHLFEISQFG